MGSHTPAPTRESTRVDSYTSWVNLILSGRGVDLDDSLRGYATEKLTRVQRFFDRIIKMELELTEERNRHGVEHRAEVIVRTPRETVRAHGEGPDHFAAIDKVSDRLEAQLKRLKSRLLQRNHREPKLVVAALPADEEESDVVRMPMKLTKPLTSDEAKLELELRDMNFVFFTDAETMRPAVLYRRADGFGLIES